MLVSCGLQLSVLDDLHGVLAKFSFHPTLSGFVNEEQISAHIRNISDVVYPRALP